MTGTQRSEIPTWRAWLVAIRPKTLPAAISPVLIGVALALVDKVFLPLPALAALAGALLIQIGANLANDYFDYVNGVDDVGRIGPTRAAQSGLIPLTHLRLGILLAFVLSVLVGFYLLIVGGWPVLAIGLASLVAALVYTGGPFPIGYHGLGDLFVFLFFGLLAVCGTYYVQALDITPAVIAASVPVGALTVAILVVNNLRDMETDRRSGKRTFAVLLGARGTRVEYAMLLTTAYAIPILFWAIGWSSSWVLLSWLTLPLALRLFQTIYQTGEGPILNNALAGTAKLDLLFSLLFAFGLVL